MTEPARTTAPSRSSVSSAAIRVLYQLLFTLLLIPAAPFLILKMLRRGQWTRGFAQRFGRYDTDLVGKLAGRRPLWLNAVSVGEVNLTVQLVGMLRQRLPESTLVVSTTTTTGMAELNRKLPDDVLKVYYPLDQRSFVRRALTTIRPAAIILIEADFWPNLLWEAQADGIPVLLVNASISARSARRYRRFGFLFRRLFASFDSVFCADSGDRQRLLDLGCRSAAVEVVGHPKFDTALQPDECPLDVRSILDRIGLPKNAPVLLGGSTHPGEEAILTHVYLQLRANHPDLFLILVPRHFERANEVANELRGMGIEVILRTELPSSPPDLSAAPHCLVVDTTGELRHFYREADIVFIGQSFVAGGGQNPLEPAVHGRAIITGPKMETFKTILPRFLEAGALIQVQNTMELASSVRGLLADPAKREDIGRRARQVVEENQGALERTAEGIVAQLSRADSRERPKVI